LYDYVWTTIIIHKITLNTYVKQSAVIHYTGTDTTETVKSRANYNLLPNPGLQWHSQGSKVSDPWSLANASSFSWVGGGQCHLVSRRDKQMSYRFSV